MKKIAILNCKNSQSVCTGASCLKAFNERQRAFAAYAGEDVELVAFWYCNGCGVPVADAGLQEKIERLLSIGLDCLHLGICTKDDVCECPTITEIAHTFEKAGVQIYRGTH